MTARRKRTTLLLICVVAVAALGVAAVFTLVGTKIIDDHDATQAQAALSTSSTQTTRARTEVAASSTGPSLLAAGTEHVHMGDSYAAGTGPDNLASGAPIPCQRTTVNPGQLLSKTLRWRTHDVACASAKTENLYVEQYFGAGPQLDALSARTRVVTSVLGANDGDFFDTLVTSCATLGSTDPSGSPCRDAYADQFRSQLTRSTGPNLRKAYRSIAAKAPNAEIFAVGYLWLVPASGACRPALRFADGDIAFVREMEALLNKQVRDAVESVGGTFVDMSELAEGHDACADADVRWIEPAYDAETGAKTGLAANHPNPLGQRAMANALEQAIRRHG